MADSFYNANNGSGTKFHTFSRTIAANVVHDEVVIPGEPYLPAYSAVYAGVSTATANSHLAQLMSIAGSNIYVRRIRVRQKVAATTAAFMTLQLFRLTTAGTGGTAVTPKAMDLGDAAAAEDARFIPAAKGTEAQLLWEETPWMVGATTATPNAPLLEWTPASNSKGIQILAGAANGLALKNVTAIAAGQVDIIIDFFEATF